MDKEKLKQRCLNVIEEHQGEIIALGKEAYKTPELGCKEFRAGKLMEGAFHEFGLEPETGVSYTGCRVSSGPKGDDPKVAVMGELDCIICDTHPGATKGRLVHACGHNVQLANLYGAALGILTSGVMEHLGGATDFIAIPVEECVDYEYRNRLISQGTIHYLGGKQELVYRGGLDDTDMVPQCHMMEIESGECYILDTKSNEFISKAVHFLRGAAHAGFAPGQGISALSMAELAMNNIHALRKTFRDEDKMRVSIVIKEGGGLVNMTPERVTMEIMARAFTVDTMEGASHKVNRSMKAVAMTLGGKVKIHGCIGYLPLNTDRRIACLYRDNMIAYEHVGEDAFMEDWEAAGSTDLRDISQIMPCIHTWVGGMKGGLRTEKYRMDDPYTAYIVSTKVIALTIIDLLWDGSTRGKEITGDFRPALTKEECLNLLKDHQVVDLCDAPDL